MDSWNVPHAFLSRTHTVMEGQMKGAFCRYTRESDHALTMETHYAHLEQVEMPSFTYWEAAWGVTYELCGIRGGRVEPTRIVQDGKGNRGIARLVWE